LIHETTLTYPSQRSHFSISILKTRFNRCTHVIALWCSTRLFASEPIHQPGRAPLDVIEECLSEHELGADKDNVAALVVEELRRLHEGVLAR